MAMLASVEIDETPMPTDDSDSYSVASPYVEFRKAILRSQSRAEDAHARDAQVSTFLMMNVKLERYRAKLEGLSRDPASVLGDDAEAPTSQSMSIALAVLKHLLSQSIEPENVSLAADGGIAIRFRPEPTKRTYLEVLNDGGQHLLQYDARGHVSVHRLEGFAPTKVAERAIQLLQSIERVLPLARAD